MAGGVEAGGGGVKAELTGRIVDDGGMDLKVILVVGAVMTAWVMLSVIGSERRRKVMEWEAKRPPAGSSIPTPAAAQPPRQ